MQVTTLAHCDAVGWEPSNASQSAELGRLSESLTNRIDTLHQAMRASAIADVNLELLEAEHHSDREAFSDKRNWTEQNERRAETAMPVRPVKGTRIEASDVRDAPPAWAEEFLDFLLPRNRNSLIGDMAEDYHKKHLPKHGPRLAPWRFWFEAVKEVAAAWLGR